LYAADRRASHFTGGSGRSRRIQGTIVHRGHPRSDPLSLGQIDRRSASAANGRFSLEKKRETGTRKRVRSKPRVSALSVFRSMWWADEANYYKERKRQTDYPTPPERCTRYVPAFLPRDFRSTLLIPRRVRDDSSGTPRSYIRHPRATSRSFQQRAPSFSLRVPKGSQRALNRKCQKEETKKGRQKRGRGGGGKVTEGKDAGQKRVLPLRARGETNVYARGDQQQTDG